jgi:hypothetical protein
MPLDALAPQTPRVTATLETHAGAAREMYQASLQAHDEGLPTPRPIAWAESGTGKAVTFVERPANTRTLQEALLFHYYEQPVCEPLMQLLQVCADAVRSMHVSGWEHGNLTTEHLLVESTHPGRWKRAWVTRMRKRPKHPGTACPFNVRGRDNGRILLPSDFLRVFQEMQFAPEVIPPEFREAEKRSRKQHPPADPHLNRDRPPPHEKDIWIWDHRSMQAIPALKSRDKRKYYRKRDLFPMIGASLSWSGRLKRETARCLEHAWSGPVEMKEPIGISINLEPDRFEKELKWLEPLGPIPLLVRMYHHETEANQLYALEAIRRLHAQGHRVKVALVQDRRAILLPTCWQRFVERVAGGCSGFVETLEVGHAINRVKWGIWNIPEYRQVLEPFQNWSTRYPQLPLMGPAGIDFEFPRILPMLNQWPEESLSALSHHLYVDRRGAPENRQNGYDLLRKLAMTRAIARLHPACDEKVVISEVNWPIKETGVWSPVGSPYQSPGERSGDPSVDEETYAEYMKRYLLLAVCSGLADQVYWWNLAAHGFGLVDDRDPAGWRPRPGYHTFVDLVNALQGSTFQERVREQNGWAYRFTRGEEAVVLRTTDQGII